MKKFRISFLAVAAIIIAATSAFTTKADVKTSDDVYYYSYSESTSHNLMDDSKWFQVSGPDGNCSSEITVNCTIQLNLAPRNVAGNPDFSAAGISTESELDDVTNNWKQ